MINTRADLINAIGDYLDRDDLTTRSTTFIQLAEKRLNRLLEDPDMEVTSTATAASSGLTALPTDFGEMVSVSTGDGALRAMGAAEFAALSQASGGRSRYFVIQDGGIGFYPARPGTGITMVYRRSLPPLTDANPLNWLLTRAPDIYLYGALLQASVFLVEDDRVAMWKAAFDEAIAELKLDGARRKWGAGPIAARVRRP